LFWKKLYKEYLLEQKRFQLKNFYLPGRFKGRKKVGRLLTNYLPLAGLQKPPKTFKLRDIEMLFPQNRADEGTFSSIVLDTLSQYLLNLDVHKDYLFFDIPCEGPYERNHVTIEKDDIVIDAGANIGDFSFLAASKGAHAHAFEPSRIIYEEYLKTNMELNAKLPGSVIPALYALSDSSGKAKFTVNRDNVGGSQLSGIASASREGNFEYEDVDLITLDGYVSKNNLTRVDFIKADIEGAERLMLKGAQSVLRDFAPKLAICTYHLPDDPQVLEQLVRQANPGYVIEHKYRKMYAYVPK
jgi:FkbM family methyltransferase